MNLLWPKFHDADFRPDKKTRMRLHLQANKAMLRSYRDMGLFMLISLIPIILVEIILFFQPITFVGVAGPTLSAIILLLLGVFIFCICQHVAFMIAIEKTYTPYVRRAIRDNGTPICIGCGHLLDTNAKTCPECGFKDETQA